jgi:hypothetical protein
MLFMRYVWLAALAVGGLALAISGVPRGRDDRRAALAVVLTLATAAVSALI